MPTPWCSTRVAKVTPGAVYESATFDQHLDLEVGGRLINVFDMTPMLAPGVAAGATADVLIAADPYTGLALHSGGAHSGEITGLDLVLSPADQTGARVEALGRKWALLRVDGIPILINPVRLEELGRVAQGTPVSWKEATLFLLGWRKSPDEP